MTEEVRPPTSTGGFSNPMTTAGDLIVGDTGGTPARLAKGADSQVLTVDPTTHLLVWTTPASGAGFASPSIALDSSAAAGAAGTVIRSDATIAAFDATAPTTQALGDSAAVGSIAFAARRDHKHAMPAAAVTSSGLTQATARLLGRTTSSTGAIEEITVGSGLSLSAGSLTATGGSSSHGFRARQASGPTISTGSEQVLAWPSTDDRDTDSYHFTSAAALTGTVAKTATSPTITGSGTSFTTELSVNQVFQVPGTATEIVVVKSIESNTSLTAWSNLANTASGQTGTRLNNYVAIPAGLGGVYWLGLNTAFTTSVVAGSYIRIDIGGVTTGAQVTVQNLLNQYGVAPGTILLQAGDWIVAKVLLVTNTKVQDTSNGNWLAGELIGS
jgi:hypothetical protein